MNEEATPRAARRTRILLADDHADFLASLRATLSTIESVEVVGLARDGEQAVRLAAEHKPELVLIDVRMPVLDGIGALPPLQAGAPKPKIVMLSMSHDRQYVRRALGHGADGYVAKTDVAEEIGDAIAAVQAGKRYLSSSVLATLKESSLGLLSAETEDILLRVIEEDGEALLWFAGLLAGNTPTAIRAFTESLAAFAMAREFSTIGNTRVWLLVSLASSLFGCASPAPATQNLAAQNGLARIGSWFLRRRVRCGEHANYEDFATYWRKSGSTRSRAALLRHLGVCRSCHLEWSSVGYQSLIDHGLLGRGERGTKMPADPDLDQVRSALLDDLREARVDRFLFALTNRDAALRSLIASDMEVLWGMNNGVDEGDRPASPALLRSRVAEFLGTKTGALAAELHT